MIQQLASDLIKTPVRMLLQVGLEFNSLISFTKVLKLNFFFSSLMDISFVYSSSVFLSNLPLAGFFIAIAPKAAPKRPHAPIMVYDALHP